MIRLRDRNFRAGRTPRQRSAPFARSPSCRKKRPERNAFKFRCQTCDSSKFILPTAALTCRGSSALCVMKGSGTGTAHVVAGGSMVEPDDPAKLMGLISLDDLLKARIRRLQEEQRRERILPLRLAFPSGARWRRSAKVTHDQRRNDSGAKWSRITNPDRWNGTKGGFNESNAKLVCNRCHYQVPRLQPPRSLGLQEQNCAVSIQIATVRRPAEWLQPARRK